MAGVVSAASSELLTATKSTSPEGTWEDASVAFQIFLGAKPHIFGSYAYYTTPHIGVYDHDDYTPALPIAIVSLPSTKATERAQLPPKLAATLARCRELGIVDKDVEVYLQIHAGLDTKPCAHLRCDNVDEFNLMLHPWVFQHDSVADTDDAMEAAIHVGIFEPNGVKTVHMELADGGTPFHVISQRRVIIHDRRFSPDNCNVQLTHETDTPTFVSLAVDRALRRAVVVFHVLPVGDGPSDRIREWLRGRTTLADLVAGLEAHLPTMAALIKPVIDHAPPSGAVTGRGAEGKAGGGVGCTGM